MLFMSCVFMLSLLFIVALWSPAGKGLIPWISFVMFNCVFFPLSHVVSWVNVVLDCIDFWSLPPFLLFLINAMRHHRENIFKLTHYDEALHQGHH